MQAGNGPISFSSVGLVSADVSTFWPLLWACRLMSARVRQRGATKRWQSVRGGSVIRRSSIESRIHLPLVLGPIKTATVLSGIVRRVVVANRYVSTSAAAATPSTPPLMNSSPLFSLSARAAGEWKAALALFREMQAPSDPSG